MARVVVRTVVATSVAGVLCAGIVAVPAPASAAVGTLRVSTSQPIAGEQVTVRLDLPGRVRRPIRLQSRVEGRWVTVRRATSSRRVTATFTLRATARSLRLRAYAPAVRRSGVRHRALTSPAAVVRPAAQAVRLSLPASARPGSKVTALVAATPVRPGRQVVLQRLAGSAWQTVSTGAQDRTGRAHLTLTASATATYRALTSARAGAAATASTSARLSVVPLPKPTPTPEPEPEPEPVSAVGRVDIATDDGLDVTSKDAYVHGTLSVTAGDGTRQVLPTRLRVRGNSTSWITMKRPYKVKLDGSASVLGMPASKDWVLLANFYDRSLLRNDAAFEAARRLGLPWAPRMKPVELWLNGTYYGLYQLGEGIEVQENRVEMPEGGLLLEADPYDDTDVSFTTTRGLRVFVKSSDDDADRAIAQARVQEIEDVLYGDGLADPETGYAAVLDVDSFIDWYLLAELTKSIDSPFKASVWMLLGPDGRLSMGPPWDYDASMGNRTLWGGAEPTGWFVRQNWYDDTLPGLVPSQYTGPEGHWFVQLFEDPAFESRVAARWREVREGLASLPAYVATSADGIAEAAERTFLPREQGGAGMPLGPTIIDNGPAFVFHGSWAAEAAALRAWLAARIAWMDDAFANVPPPA